MAGAFATNDVTLLHDFDDPTQLAGDGPCVRFEHSVAPPPGGVLVDAQEGGGGSNRFAARRLSTIDPGGAAVSFDLPTLVIAAAAAALLLKLFLSRRAPPAVVSEKLQAGATVLDVRSEAEFRGGAYRRADSDLGGVLSLAFLVGVLQELQNRPDLAFALMVLVALLW